MGYYTKQYGDIAIDPSVEPAAVDALKALNHDHDAKRGGSFPVEEGADPYEVRWYSWMPPRYHEDEDITEVRDVLEMLGYSVLSDGIYPSGLRCYTVEYDNKTGQEDVFLNRLADFAHVTITVRGEDDAEWKWSNAGVGQPLVYSEGVREWVGNDLVSAMLAEERERWARLRATRV